MCNQLYISITLDSLYYELSILSRQLELIRTPLCLSEDLFKKELNIFCLNHLKENITVSFV